MLFPFSVLDLKCAIPGSSEFFSIPFFYRTVRGKYNTGVYFLQAFAEKNAAKKNKKYAVSTAFANYRVSVVNINCMDKIMLLDLHCLLTLKDTDTIVLLLTSTLAVTG